MQFRFCFTPGVRWGLSNTGTIAASTHWVLAILSCTWQSTMMHHSLLLTFGTPDAITGLCSYAYACRDHLNSLCTAVTKDNVNLAAYFAWTLLDNFEWTEGYRARYGIVHVDRGSQDLTRYPKLSAYWLSHHFFRWVLHAVLHCDGCMAAESALTCRN